MAESHSLVVLKVLEINGLIFWSLNILGEIQNATLLTHETLGRTFLLLQISPKQEFPIFYYYHHLKH